MAETPTAPTKRQLEEAEKYVKPTIRKQILQQKREESLQIPADSKLTIQLISSEDSSQLGPLLQVSASSTPAQLSEIVNKLQSNDEELPFSFHISTTQLENNLHQDFIVDMGMSSEKTLQIVFKPQAIFKVRTVTRCSSSLSGHSEAVLVVLFSPDGKFLATGSGDCTIRLWDLNTETPKYTLKGHSNWVQILCWSPDGRILASGMDKTVRLWNPKTGEAFGDPLKSHSQVITGICWEPLHLNKDCNRFASSSKDATVKVWNSTTRQVLFSLTSHTAPITCIKWGGSGLIYSASRDKSVRVWSGSDGKLVRVLDGHAHWVNSLAVSSDFIVRTGAYDHTWPKFKDSEEMYQAAITRFEKSRGNSQGERVASCSDDFTIFIWIPETSKKPVTRLTGHQQLVNHISFSPDGNFLASASFDKSVKLWDGMTGNFITTLKGHVGSVYQTTFSSDSRQVISCSKDSTLKAYDLRTRKLKVDLPGHADEVYSVDWSPSGDRVASGGKDRVVKMWKH